MADRPAVRTVPNVELFTVGTWPASTGPVTWVPDDIAAAVAAQDDPSYNTPVVKLGHVDPRFDGNPALGRIINMRASDDGQTCIGDLAGVPTWLADLIDGQREDPEGGANAYPFRSIEGEFGFTTAAGRHHRFAVTALSLLGDMFPAVSTLAGIATLYGVDPVEVAASAAASLQEVIVPQPPAVVRAGSVEVEQVRNAFYAADYGDKVGMWAWVRTVLMGTDGDTNAVIVDDDEGSLWSVPWTVDAASRTVTFDWENKQRKGIEYVDLADPPEAQVAAAATGALRSRIAHMVQTSTAPPNTTTPPEPTIPAAQPAGQEGRESDPVAFELNDEQAAALRTRLGLADDATPEQVAAALMAAPGPDDGAGTNTDQARMQIPAGAVLVDAAQLEELQRGAQQGVEANRRLRNSDRDQQIAAAVTDGKISRARVEHWTQAWDKDPEGIRDTLAAMPKNLIPVTAAGYTPGASDDDIDAEFASIFPPKAGD